MERGYCDSRMVICGLNHLSIDWVAPDHRSGIITCQANEKTKPTGLVGR